MGDATSDLELVFAEPVAACAVQVRLAQELLASSAVDMLARRRDMLAALSAAVEVLTTLEYELATLKSRQFSQSLRHTVCASEDKQLIASWSGKRGAMVRSVARLKGRLTAVSVALGRLSQPEPHKSRHLELELKRIGEMLLGLSKLTSP